VTSARSIVGRATAGPDYSPDQRDLAELRVAGLSFPVRASIVVVAMTALLTADQVGLGRPSAGVGGVLSPIALARVVLFGLVPLAIVVLLFRDQPGRYGLGPGDWRWGFGLLLAGLAVMTPVILALGTLPQFRDYYGAAPAALIPLIANHLAELIPAEFLLRGFVMFTLWRRIGPLALVVSLVPFVLTHVGKPDVELWSTFIGGSVFAWLDWRTGSILWSALGHVYVLTLMQLAVGGATV
jgi:hypothetical protein